MRTLHIEILIVFSKVTQLIEHESRLKPIEQGEAELEVSHRDRHMRSNYCVMMERETEVANQEALRLLETTRF